MAAIGLALGLTLSVGVAYLIASLLIGVEALDPGATAAALGILTVATIVAGLLPALRAGKVDPIRALRCE